MTWGKYGKEPACEHLVALRTFLVTMGLSVWSEDGEEPFGWVNVHCEKCGRTYETVLDEPWCDEDWYEDPTCERHDANPDY